jgi:hypothetical protein
MLSSLKGIYHWKLVDNVTGDVVDEGSQKNTITDSLLYSFRQRYSGEVRLFTTRIVLSTTTTPLPGGFEYRAYGVASTKISRTVVSGDLTASSYSVPLGSVTWSNNFAPPVAPRTITIFGLDMAGSVWNEFASFVELSTSITQTPTQSLFVSYSLFFDFSSSGSLNVPNNNYVDTEAKRVFVTGGNCWINAPTSGGYSEYCIAAIYTPWGVDSLDLNKVARGCGFAFYNRTIVSPYKEADEGTYLATKSLIQLVTTDYFGPIGAITFGKIEHTGCHATFAVCPGSHIVPSISRVFAHPESRKRTVVFSDPSYPPASRGSTTLSGTPTNKWPWLTGRIHITKTGDASDIVGGAISGTAADDFITVTETGWAVDDQITLEGGSLPAPLTATTYWVVNVSTYDLKLATSQSGTPITLSGSGSGTCERYNTGKYRLEYNSTWFRHTSMSLVSSYIQSSFLHQLDLPKTYEGVIQSAYDATFRSHRASWRKGDYVYSIHDVPGGTRWQYAKWRFASLESVEAIGSTLKSAFQIRSAVRGSGSYADIVFLATNDGVYQWDLADPTTMPTKVTITGLVNDGVKDVSFDSVRGFLWTGHSTGLSKVNLAAGTATTYTIAGGQLSGGLDSSEVDVCPGRLDAYDGRVICGVPGYYSGTTWVLDDDHDGGGSIGWYRIFSGNTHGASHRHSNRLHIVHRSGDTWSLFSLTVTGKGTGTLTTVVSQSSNNTTGYYSAAPIIRFNDFSFAVFHSNLIYYWNLTTGLVTEIHGYVDGFDQWFHQGYFAVSSVINEPDLRGLGYAAVARCPIDIDNGINVHLASTCVLMQRDIQTPTALDLTSFGWSGAAWVKDSLTERLITKTGAVALLSGVSVQFQNSTGQPWDTQFVSGERFSWVQAPTPVKDNLQTYDIRARYYQCNVKRVVDWSTTGAASRLIPECTTGAAPDPDFRDLDTVDYVTRVYDDTTATELTRSLLVSPPTGTYYMTSLGEFVFNAAQYGDTILLTYNYTVF